LNITHILTVARALHPKFQSEITYHLLDVDDWLGEDLLSHFEDAFSFIDFARSLHQPLLVHCLAGVSRSVTVVIGYLMKRENMDFRHAVELVQSKRQVASPNKAFLRQLQIYESIGHVVDKNSSIYVLYILERFYREKKKLYTLATISSGLDPHEYTSKEHITMITNELKPLPKTQSPLSKLLKGNAKKKSNSDTTIRPYYILLCKM